MARPVKHDGGLYKREESKIWWMRYRDKGWRPPSRIDPY